MRKYSLFILVMLSFAMFFACAKDDDFSSNQEYALTFSIDVIDFDTVFVNKGSATKKFKIYNPNSKSLKIESIELVNPSVSGFRMNIDGEKGTRLTNIEILKKDSLYGFVEVTIEPNNAKNPSPVSDSIRFVTNGNVQYVRLDAVGLDVFAWKGKIIERDTVITNEKPILIHDTLTIASGVEMKIEEGVTFYLSKDAAIVVHGTIKAKGSVNAPVVFRGDRFDKIERNIPYDNVSGQWGGIYFHSGSYDNCFENVCVRNAEKGMTYHLSSSYREKATLINTTIHNSSEYCLFSVGNHINAENCLFTNSGTAVVALQGGKYSFVHCTFANYYRWGPRRLEALVLKNYSNAGDKMPLLKCDFINSIIYGSLSNELFFDKWETEEFRYQFINCLIKGKVVEDESFVHVIWNLSPLFKDVDSNKIHQFNFDIQKDSPAIDRAEKSYSLSVPYDIKGRSRLRDSNPDIGCYEWID